MYTIWLQRAFGNEHNLQVPFLELTDKHFLQPLDLKSAASYPGTPETPPIYTCLQAKGGLSKIGGSWYLSYLKGYWELGADSQGNITAYWAAQAPLGRLIGRSCAAVLQSVVAS